MHFHFLHFSLLYFQVNKAPFQSLWTTMQTSKSLLFLCFVIRRDCVVSTATFISPKSSLLPIMAGWNSCGLSPNLRLLCCHLCALPYDHTSHYIFNPFHLQFVLSVDIPFVFRCCSLFVSSAFFFSMSQTILAKSALTLYLHQVDRSFTLLVVSVMNSNTIHLLRSLLDLVYTGRWFMMIVN